MSCEESPDGEHSFVPDIEYDQTGKTINCEFCGEPKPKRIKMIAKTNLIQIKTLNSKYAAQIQHATLKSDDKFSIMKVRNDIIEGEAKILGWANYSVKGGSPRKTWLLQYNNGLLLWCLPPDETSSSPLAQYWNGLEQIFI